MLVRDKINMITEITTAAFFAMITIGIIMALKWKKKNSKPRLSDAEKEKIRKRHVQ